MPIVTPDDPVRDLPWIWPGPKHVRLPAAPIAQYGMFLALWGFTSTVAFVSVATPRQWLIATVPLAVAALAITKWAFRHVDSIRTLRYYRDTFRADTVTPRPPVDPGPDEGAITYQLSPAVFATRKDHP